MIKLRCKPLSDNDLNKRGIIRFGKDVRAHLPPGAVGGSSLDAFAPDPVTFHWRGDTSQIDMPLDDQGRNLRWFFRSRERGFLLRFLRESGAEMRDLVVLEQIGPRDYRLQIETTDTEKARVARWALRETRPEQQKFRREIAERDGLKCAITGCAIPEILDAAHIAPRAPGGSDDPANGMILRADIHRLFDAGLLSIDTAGTVSISVAVTDIEYLRLQGEAASTSADLAKLAARAIATAGA
ncbi:HNH endonuclease [Litorisediminicola beolgyonensis]|uniref:HNH endonuclease n=1 Tax=Litorisediminicola beolgyonensis TaxID=1173614 RepID=A0ABW3ZIU4_9RHOB